jgi:transmembrane sensor
MASDWVVRRESGLTAAERAAFDQWCAADPRHRAALDRLGRTWTLLERLPT